MVRPRDERGALLRAGSQEPAGGRSRSGRQARRFSRHPADQHRGRRAQDGDRRPGEGLGARAQGPRRSVDVRPPGRRRPLVRRGERRLDLQPVLFQERPVAGLGLHLERRQKDRSVLRQDLESLGSTGGPEAALDTRQRIRQPASGPGQDLPPSHHRRPGQARQGLLRRLREHSLRQRVRAGDRRGADPPGEAGAGRGPRHPGDQPLDQRLHRPLLRTRQRRGPGRDGADRPAAQPVLPLPGRGPFPAVSRTSQWW